VLVAAVLVSSAGFAEPAQVKLPMTCSRGPDAQWFSAVVTMPAAQQAGATVAVRIDSTFSGTIKHFGLHYIHGMTTDYRIPAGATYVEGSVRLVEGTGTPNVTKDARAWHDAAGIHLALPARVDNGASYLPPSIEFEMTIAADPPASVSVEFVHYEVAANVVLLGDLKTTCDPSSRPATIGVTKVEPPARREEPLAVSSAK